mgnify:CR=1 FL=1
MKGKTITLDAAAYRKLKTWKRPGETFSSVVLRTEIREGAPTGEELLEWAESDRETVSEKYLGSVEEAEQSDSPPVDPWS